MTALMRSWLGDGPVGVVACAVTVDEDRAVARSRARTEVAMHVGVLDRMLTMAPDLSARVRAVVTRAHTRKRAGSSRTIC